MDSISCLYCGSVISADALRCPQCGAAVERTKDPQRAESAKSVYRESDPETGHASGLVACVDCGREISPHALMCPHCGAPRAGAVAHVSVATISRRDWGFEWRSSARIGSWPLVHVAWGRANGKLRVARGIVAIGQFAIGFFTLAQFGVAFVFGIGQFLAGPILIAQFAIGIVFGLGQFATGFVAIGQFALGGYVLGQMGLGVHAWTTHFKDPAAIEFFRGIWHSATS